MKGADHLYMSARQYIRIKHYQYQRFIAWGTMVKQIDWGEATEVIEQHKEGKHS
mgnify:CR=1 FL=1